MVSKKIYSFSEVLRFCSLFFKMFEHKLFLRFSLGSVQMIRILQIEFWPVQVGQSNLNQKKNYGWEVTLGTSVTCFRRRDHPNKYIFLQAIYKSELSETFLFYLKMLFLHKSVYIRCITFCDLQCMELYSNTKYL